MELRPLRDFLTVMDCGTLDDAARRLKVTRTALTKCVPSRAQSQRRERISGASVWNRAEPRDNDPGDPPVEAP